MKAAFIFDTVLLQDKENYYGMTLTYDFFRKKYLDKFDSIIVATRVASKNNKNAGSQGYKMTNGENVTAKPIRSYKNIANIFLQKKKIQSEIEAIIREVDIVIIRMPSILGIIAAKQCRKLNKKYVIECVACAYDGYMNHANPIGKLIAIPIFLATKTAIRKAPNVIYVTNNFLQNRYPTRGNQLACSDVIIPQNIRPKKNYNLNQPIKLFTVANVEMKYKGHIYALKAMNELKKKGIETDYYLIGNGDTQRLSKIAHKHNLDKNIHFLGSLPHDEVLDQLRIADIYIQPSLQEGMPRALIEAMSVGCPAIASNAGGNPELLQPKFIFKKRKYKQLAKIITSFKENNISEQAGKENIEKTKKFNENDLDNKRNKFYYNFIQDV